MIIDPATEVAQLERMVDEVLNARTRGVRAHETFLVKLLDMVLFAAAERLVELRAKSRLATTTTSRPRKPRRAERARSRRSAMH